ncbi:hypothetical protein GCM10023261_00860 [Bartonella jaculi]|uniref:HIG1 domain-containing protein n=1 Tax=Bartonella jaculi TaxID=686226 RepID=A0ABP9MWL0_9HYPH
MNDLIRIIVELLFSIGALFMFFYTLFSYYKSKGYNRKEIWKKILLRIFLFVILFSITFFIYIRYFYEQ